jgi:hypothetical protein
MPVLTCWLTKINQTKIRCLLDLFLMIFKNINLVVNLTYLESTLFKTDKQDKILKLWFVCCTCRWICHFITSTIGRLVTNWLQICLLARPYTGFHFILVHFFLYIAKKTMNIVGLLSKLYVTPLQWIHQDACHYCKQKFQMAKLLIWH